MNRILTIYLLRQLATAFVFATGAVTFVVLFAQSFHLLSLVIENSATMLIFFELLGLSALAVLPLIMPLGLGIAVVFIYNKLAMDSELVVMRTAGVSPFRLIQPAVLLALFVALLCGSLTLWITPAASRDAVLLQRKMRDSYAVFLSHPGSFNDLSDGLTFYANKRGQGSTLQGILIQDVREPDKTITTMADTGEVVGSEGNSRMMIFNGRRQEFDRATGKLSELAFDQYVLDLEALRNAPTKRYPDPRELTVAELINPSPDLIRARGPISRFKGELNSRLATPLLSFSYAFIALAAVVSPGFNRRGMARRILAAALAMVVSQAAYMTINSLIARNSGLTVLLYVTALLPVPFGVAFVGGDFISRRVFVRRMRIWPRILRRVFS
ncbi:MAG: LptF/LptG family permease [Alphaproteobacteria bacterium]|nr:LptF/LptG family permease [Alphaproteobacteria bacterium]